MVVKLLILYQIIKFNYCVNFVNFVHFLLAVNRMTIIKMNLADGFVFRSIWLGISVKTSSYFHLFHLFAIWSNNYLLISNQRYTTSPFQHYVRYISNSDSVRCFTLILKKPIWVNRSESGSRNSHNHWGVMFVTYSETTVSNLLNPSNINVLFSFSGLSFSCEGARSILCQKALQCAM